MSKQIICPNPNCGYVGPPRTKRPILPFILLPVSLLVGGCGVMEWLTGGSPVAFVVGLGMFILAFMYDYLGTKKLCPQCGMRIE